MIEIALIYASRGQTDGNIEPFTQSNKIVQHEQNHKNDVETERRNWPSKVRHILHVNTDKLPAKCTQSWTADE